MSKSKRKLKRVPSQPGQVGAPDDGILDDQTAESADGSNALSEMADAADSDANQTARLPTAKNAMTKPEQQKQIIDPEVPHTFKRAAWKHFFRFPFAATLIMLNIAVVGSFVTRLPQGKHLDPIQELIGFGAVWFIDFFMFIPMVFECNTVKTDANGLNLSTLLWKVRLTWDEVVKFDQPGYLKFSILRTKKGFYLFHKYDLKPSYFELAEIISAKMPPAIEDKGA